MENEETHQGADYGPLQSLLEDDEVEEIWINSPQRIFIARSGKSELTNIVLSASELQSIMDRILMRSGRRIDGKDGSLITIAMNVPSGKSKKKDIIKVFLKQLLK